MSQFLEPHLPSHLVGEVDPQKGQGRVSQSCCKHTGSEFRIRQTIRQHESRLGFLHPTPLRLCLSVTGSPDFWSKHGCDHRGPEVYRMFR